MSSSTSEPGLLPAAENSRAVLCSKCEHLNPCGSNACSRCGAHLYVSCADCGFRNERVRSRCRSCHRRLHRSLSERISAQIRPKGISPNPRAIALSIIVAALALVLINYFTAGPK